MKKFATIALAVVLSMGILTGCGSSKKAAEATTEVKEETVDYGQGLNEDGTLEGVKATDYVTVCDYSALKIPKKEVKVSDSDVQTEIDTILSSYNQVTDRKVKKGDTVNIDYKGMVDGKEFDGGTASGASLKIGSGTFIDGFEDQLIGKMPGETVQVKVTFPKDYQGKEVAGKDAVFETTINYIDETPKLTDKFVKEKLSDRYGYTTVKEMKKTIRDEIFKTNKTDYIWNHMIEKSKFKEIPDELINDRVDVLVNGLKAQLKASNYTLKDYLSAYGIEDETTLRDQYKSSCESTVKVFLIADAIAADYDVKLYEVLTGFKFIGQKMLEFETKGNGTYLFGMEESYGCLPGTYCRDKDAVVASMALCEAAAYYKTQGKTLWDAMLDLYEKYGYYKDDVKAITLKGIEGLAKIQEIMTTLRDNTPAQIGEYKVLKARDYKKDTVTDLATGAVTPTGLPNSNVLYYELPDAAWVCFRPSGTEPKLKFYYGVKADTMEAADAKAAELGAAVMAIVEPMLG